MRLGVGDEVELFDGAGSAFRGKIVAVSGDRVEVLAVEEAKSPPARRRLVAAAAAPKGDRLDWMVEKAVELGVDKLVLFRSRRSVTDPALAKVERLRRRVIEACKQCGRNRLPALESGGTFEQAIAAAPEGSIRLLACPEGAGPGAWPSLETAGEVWIAIGPEGGFEPAEASFAASLGWTRVSLGERILRVETAVLASAAILAFRLGMDAS